MKSKRIEDFLEHLLKACERGFGFAAAPRPGIVRSISAGGRAHNATALQRLPRRALKGRLGAGSQDCPYPQYQGFASNAQTVHPLD